MSLIKKITSFENNKNTLENIKIEDIINSFDKFSKKILKSNNFLNNKYRGYGLPFIAYWCSKNNLIKILTEAFGSINKINNSTAFKRFENFSVLPKGILSHWIAGNVPTLGFLSLILGIVTKNKNIVRLPSFSKNILDDILNVFKKTDNTSKKIFNNILVLKYDKSNLDISKKISIISDARLIWGSDETCKQIKNLETKLHCEDLIFSNKTSFIIIDNDTLKNPNDSYIKKISKDILVFDQKACASPHTIFLEKPTIKQIDIFCEKLSNHLNINYKKYQFSPIVRQKKIEILNLRLQYAMKEKVFADHKNFSFTVLQDKQKNLGPTIENGTIFVKKLPKLKHVKKFQNNIQTLGVYKLNKNLIRYICELRKKGLARVKLVGEMTNFEAIWDGMSIPSKITKLSTNFRI